MYHGKHLTRRQTLTALSTLAGSATLSPGQAWTTMTATPAQVEGPFYPDQPASDTDLDLTHISGHTESATGETILVRGQVLNEQGQPLGGATVDVWQANHHGRYRHLEDPNTEPLDEHFQGWGVVRTDAEGRYHLKTILPGPYPLEPLGGQGWRCRHIHFKLSHPQSKPLVTQMYFHGDPLIEADEEIAKAPEALRHLLIAQSTQDQQTGLPVYGFDLVLATV